jgi:hypothetical protein
MITALNLLPVGQLDGGHIAHALFGRRRAQTIGSATLVALVGLGLFVWSGLLFWALIVFFIAGRPGMPPMEDVTRLDVPRRAVAWGSGSTAPTCDVRSLERYEMTFAKPDD